MGLPAARFSERVQIQQRVVTGRNAMGGDIFAWQPAFAHAADGYIAASVEPLRAREWFAAAQMQASADYRVTLRYRTGITSDMRVLWRGEPLEIVGPPIDVKARHENIELMCASGVRNG